MNLQPGDETCMAERERERERERGMKELVFYAQIGMKTDKTLVREKYRAWREKGGENRA